MAQETTAGLQINISEYIAAKAAGVTSVVRLNGVPHYTRKGFDPVNGTPRPILVPLDRDQLVAVLEQMKANVENMEAVLSDLDAAEELIAKG